MKKVGQLKVKSLMKKRFIKVHTQTPIKKILKIFDREKISVLPVFSRKKFVGEIFQIDLLKLVVDVKKIPKEEIIDLDFGFDFGYFAKKAKDIMTEHETHISPDALIEEAAWLMIKEDIRSLVVQENNRFVGILTENEIIKAILKRSKK